jgi:tetrahydromethanopterin S-methyltransferase subunit H
VSVYVDNARLGYGRMKMCHMVADTREELLAMADRIGVQRKWLQNAGTPTEHFDVCAEKRRAAIKAGAQEVTGRGLVTVIRGKRASLNTGKDGT